MKNEMSPNSPGLVAVMNNRPDLDRAQFEHWYRIPVQSAPDDVRQIRWIAFYLTKAFGPEKWSVRYWAKVLEITKTTRADLLPTEKHHPRSQNLYYRLGLGPLQVRPEAILSRRRRRIVFIPSDWKKFTAALEINDLVHGSPLEDRLWAAFKQEKIEAERQWWEGDKKTRYCLDFALFCPQRNIDVECDGDRWHINPESAAHDNARNNFLEQRGWHVLRFNTAQLTDDLPGCVRNVTTLINRCGGLMMADESIKQIPVTELDGTKQLWLFDEWGPTNASGD
jgi:very-short-patch-repair endonuclease